MDSSPVITHPTFSLMPSSASSMMMEGGGSGSMPERNANIHMVTAVTQVRMVNPIDCSEVTNEMDKKRLLEVDKLICDLTDAMPLLQKSKPKRVGTKYYNVTYSWDDAYYMFPGVVLNQTVYEKGFLRGWFFNNRHIRLEVWTDEEYRRQHGLAVAASDPSDERGIKRPRIELEHS